MSNSLKSNTALDLKDLIKLIIDQNLSRESAIALTHWYSNPDGDSLEVKLGLLRNFENQLKNASSCSSADLAEVYHALIRNNAGVAKSILSKYSKETQAKPRSFTPIPATKPTTAVSNPNPHHNFQPPNSSQNKYNEDFRSVQIYNYVNQSVKAKQLDTEENVQTLLINQQPKPEAFVHTQSPRNTFINPSIITRNHIPQSEETKGEPAYRNLSQDRSSAYAKNVSFNMSKPEEGKRTPLDLKIPDYSKNEQELDEKVDDSRVYKRTGVEETEQVSSSDRHRKDVSSAMIGAGSLSTKPDDLIKNYNPQTAPKMMPFSDKSTKGYNNITPNDKLSSIPGSKESLSSHKQSEQPPDKNTPHYSQFKTSQARNSSYQSIQSTSFIPKRSDNPKNTPSNPNAKQLQYKAQSIAIPSQQNSRDFTYNQPITPSGANPSSTKNSVSSRKPIAPKDTLAHTPSRRSLDKDTRCCNCGTTVDTVIVGSCNHFCCKSCLMRYAAGQMINNTFPNQCPVKSCSNEMDGGTVLSVLPNNFKEKYEELSLRQFLVSDAGTKVVRCIGCSNTLTVDAKVTHMECPYCKKYYCLNCNSLSHPGKTCDEQAKYRSRSSVPIQKTSYYRR
jgi:hypothetical protein